MIAAYQRISRADGDLGKDGKDKSNSIENQKELILRYISCKESLQNVPVMDFVDDGYTGSNFDRPGFQRMMDGVRNGKIDTIIVKDLSRFGRDYIGVGEYMEQIFPLLGVRLIAINDNYDSNNYKGTTLGMDVVVSNLVNTMYCRDAGKKLRTANQVKWRKGITTASAAPFGYQFDPDKKGAFIIDPPAAKIVRRIFDLAILGLGTREIAMMEDASWYGSNMSRASRMLREHCTRAEFQKRLSCPCCNIRECVIIWATDQPERGHYESDSMAVKIGAGDYDPATDPCCMAGKVVCGIPASLFCMDFLSAGQCATGNGDSFVPHAAVARGGSTSNADRWICDFYDTAGGRQRGRASGTGGSNASAGMVHIK